MLLGRDGVRCGKMTNGCYYSFRCARMIITSMTDGSRPLDEAFWNWKIGKKIARTRVPKKIIVDTKITASSLEEDNECRANARVKLLVTCSDRNSIPHRIKELYGKNVPRRSSSFFFPSSHPHSPPPSLPPTLHACNRRRFLRTSSR